MIDQSILIHGKFNLNVNGIRLKIRNGEVSGVTVCVLRNPSQSTLLIRVAAPEAMASH